MSDLAYILDGTITVGPWCNQQDKASSSRHNSVIVLVSALSYSWGTICREVMASSKEGAYLSNGGEIIHQREEELPQTKHDSVRVIKVYWVEEIMMLQRGKITEITCWLQCCMLTLFSCYHTNLVVIALCSVLHHLGLKLQCLMI